MKKKEVLLVARCWCESSLPYGYCLLDTGGTSPGIDCWILIANVRPKASTRRNPFPCWIFFSR